MSKCKSSDAVNQAPSQAAQSGTRQQSERNFLILSKNLCNYPLARDPRTKMTWRRRKSGWWSARLPYDSRITLRLPPNVQETSKRAPTAFDMQLLSILLMLARKQGTRVVISSRSVLVELMGHSAETRTLRRLDDALQYLSAVRLRYAQWWTPGKGREPKKLRPPIRAVNKPSGTLCITISPTWLALSDNFAVQVPSPLPNTAAAQNLVLLLMVGFRKGHEVNHRRDIKTVIRKIGAAAATRKVQLPKTIEVAKAWFKQHGGRLAYATVRSDQPAMADAIRGGTGEIITFVIQDPKIPKSEWLFKQEHEERRRAAMERLEVAREQAEAANGTYHEDFDEPGAGPGITRAKLRSRKGR